MNVLPVMQTWFDSLGALLFPRCCVVCGCPLARGEECLCSLCNMNLPRTNYHLQVDNPVEKLFWGKIPIERGASFFFYRKGGDFSHILHLLKYKGQKEIGEVMGRYMAAEMRDAGFFRGVDMLIPVPLHVKRLRSRGYNQSEWIARGVSEVTGIPIHKTAVARQRNTETQTHKSAFERWQNMEDTFVLCDESMLVGKHVLIIDDVLTTGATTVGCAACLMEVRGIRISVLTLAMAE